MTSKEILSLKKYIVVLCIMVFVFVFMLAVFVSRQEEIADRFESAANSIHDDVSEYAEQVILIRWQLSLESDRDPRKEWAFGKKKKREFSVRF